MGELDGYTQVDPQYGIDGEIWHTAYDNLDYIEETFPGRVEERLSTFTKVLTNLLVEMEEPGLSGLRMSGNLVSLTEAREIEVAADFGYMPNLDNIQWTLGGKAFSEWKKFVSSLRTFTGDPWITFTQAPMIEGTTVKAKIKTQNLMLPSAVYSPGIVYPILHAFHKGGFSPWLNLKA